MKAEQAAQVDADRQARAETSASLTPVTDAEIARYGASAEPEPKAEPVPEAEAGAAETGQDRSEALGRAQGRASASLGAKVDAAARQEAERASRTRRDRSGSH